jgi:hypothetical protein
VTRLAESMLSAGWTKITTKPFAAAHEAGPVIPSNSVVDRLQRIFALQILVEQTQFALPAMTILAVTDLSVPVLLDILETL